VRDQTKKLDVELHEKTLDSVKAGLDEQKKKQDKELPTDGAAGNPELVK
jgi:hypothetical protein